MGDIETSIFEFVATSVVVLVLVFLILPIYIRMMRSLVEEGSRHFSALSEVFRVLAAVVSSILEINIQLKKREGKKEDDPAALRKDLESAKAELATERENLERARAELHLVQSDALPEEYLSTAKNWRPIFKASRNRLLVDAARLKSKSTTNLGLGLAFSGFSAASLVIVLVFFIPDPHEQELYVYLAQLFPRFAVVVLLQYIASFFLKLYAANERDLEMVRNEITNSEMKLVALEAASESSDNIQLAALLMLDDRNRIASEALGSEYLNPIVESIWGRMIAKIKGSD